MAKPFPANDPFMRGYYAPLHMECDAEHLQITGEMPRELHGTLYRNGPNPQQGARLVRWTFDLSGNSGHYTEQALNDLPGEYPRLDERFAMQGYRHGYIMSASIGDTVLGGRDARAGIAHIDLQTGDASVWEPELGDYCGEPIFVERGADAAEGDGWLLSVIYRGTENRSDLAVFDARDVAGGPIALAHLSHRVPAGLHGNWRARST